MNARLRRKILIWVGCILALALVLLCVVPPKVATAPVRLTRDARGTWHTADGQPWPPQPAIFMQWRKSEEQTSLTSSCMKGTNGSARFACAHIAIMPQSNHLLLTRVAEGLVTEWMKQPFAQEISYIPYGCVGKVGDPTPDLYLTLTLLKVHNNGGPWARQLTATVHVALRSHPGGEFGWYSGQYGPPVVIFDCTADIDYKEKQRALTSSSLRYQAEGEAIARQVAKSLGDTCTSNLQQYGDLPTLPATFTPAYQPPPSMPFLRKYHATRVLSTHGVLTATDTYWRISAPKRTLHEFLTEVWREQTAHGWQGVRPTRGSNLVLLYQKNEARRLWIVNESQQEANAAQIVVLYQARLTHDQFLQAMDGLLTDPMRALDALAFMDRLTPRQQGRVITQLQAHPPSTVDSCLALTELLQRRHQLRDARRLLQRAYVLQQTVSGDVNQQHRMDQLAYTLQVTLRLTAPLLQQCGFQRQRQDGSYPTMTIGVNGAAKYFAQTGNGLSTMSIAIKSVAGIAGKHYQATQIVRNDDGGIGIASQGTDDMPLLFPGGSPAFSSWQFTVQRTNMRPPRFTITPRHI